MSKNSTQSAHFEDLLPLKDTMDQRHREVQVQYEMKGVDRGAENVRRMLAASSTSLVDTEPGRKIFADMMNLLIPAIKSAQLEASDDIANGGRGVKKIWKWLILYVPAEKLAYITVRSILAVRMHRQTLGRKGSAITLDIGNGVKMQTEFEMWAKRSAERAAEEGGVDVAKLLIARAKNMNARQWDNWRRRMDDIERLEWQREDKMHIGSKLLEIAVQHGGGFFELKYEFYRNKSTRYIFLSEICRTMIDDVNTHLEINTPVMRPMLARPDIWRWSESHKRYLGGYYKIPIDFIRGGIHHHTADLQNPLSSETLQAADAVGGVQWRVNQPSLNALLEARKHTVSWFSSIPNPDPIQLQSKSDDEWNGMDKKARAEWKYDRMKQHEQNHKDMSKREAAHRKINTAIEMKDHKSFFYPQKVDTRGRLYPIPPDLNPQSDSIGRGLIEFANGEPLGPRGLYWMRVKLCNTYGYDKVTFEDMQAWCDEHHDLIVDSGDDPIDGFRFWRQADKQLEFIGVAREYAEATRLDNEENYISHQLSSMDGSNNGLQLLSLLGRDPIGAKLTNCSSSLERYDLYEETAEILKMSISKQAIEGDEMAMKWAGKIDRAVTKRACMTTPYGVTPRGIADQLIADGHVEDLEGSPIKNASYLRNYLIEALEETIVASRPIMVYFQEVATALAEANRPLRWRVPTGSTIQQSYWNIQKSDVKTVMGSFLMWDQDPEGGLNVRKQALGSAPNVIHSLDAALLHKVVNELVSRKVYSFSTIHDSFSVHYRHTDELRDVIRQQAYQMFKGDWLKDEFHRYVSRHAGIDLPEPPKQGSFDVSEVLSAPYFFA